MSVQAVKEPLVILNGASLTFEAGSVCTGPTFLVWTCVGPYVLHCNRSRPTCRATESRRRLKVYLPKTTVVWTGGITRRRFNARAIAIYVHVVCPCCLQVPCQQSCRERELLRPLSLRQRGRTGKLWTSFEGLSGGKGHSKRATRLLSTNECIANESSHAQMEER